MTVPGQCKVFTDVCFPSLPITSLTSYRGAEEMRVTRFTGLQSPRRSAFEAHSSALEHSQGMCTKTTSVPGQSSAEGIEGAHSQKGALSSAPPGLWDVISLEHQACSGLWEKRHTEEG